MILIVLGFRQQQANNLFQTNQPCDKNKGDTKTKTDNESNYQIEIQ